MDHAKINYLYKYISFSERSISALLTNKLWFPKPNTLNDPFDCAIVNHSKNLLEYIKRKRKEMVKSTRQVRPDESNQTDFGRKFYELCDNAIIKTSEKDRRFVSETEKVYSVFQSSINNFGILSLSETPKNILMWSHYALNHTGMVFEFERSELNKLGKDAKPITYSNKRECEDQASHGQHYDLFYVKHSGWRYEREWRLLEGEGNQFYDFPARLNSVICGALMPDQNIETLTILIESINSNRNDKISIKYAKMHSKQYSISICKQKPRK